MFAALGRFAHRRHRAVLLVYAALLPLAVFLGRDVLDQLKAGGFDDPGAESWHVRDDLVRELGVGSPDMVALYTNARGGNVDDIDMMAGVLAALAEVEKDPAVVRVLTYYSTGVPALVSKDRTRTFAVITLRGDDQAKEEAFVRIEPLLAVEGCTLNVAGIAAVNRELNATIERDIRRAEILAFPVTAALLIFIFGSVASAALPLVVGFLAVALAFLAVRGLVEIMDLSIFCANIVSVLGLGLAIDYSLFIVNRYREELPDRGVEGAVVHTMATTGRAIAFSGITVAASLCGLLVFPQMYLRSMAVGGVCVVLCAVVLAVTLLPALLSALGTRVDALRIPWAPQTQAASVVRPGGFWHLVAFGVMRRPMIVALIVVVPLLLLAVPFLRIDPSIPDHKILPQASPARVAMSIIDGEFLAHQVAPHDVLVRIPGRALARENLERLLALHREMEALPGVSKVESPLSLVDAVGKERAFELLDRPPETQDQTLQALLDVSVKEAPDRSLVRFAVVSTEDFNQGVSLRQVQALRALAPPPGGSIEVGGIAAILWDLKRVVAARAPWMVALVSAVMFVVLFLVFGSVTLPLKAMVMNSLSLTASFGAIVWIFQDGRFTDFLAYEPLGISDATQPLLMFAVVFGLSMDYEVLLLSRVREEYVRTGDNTLSVAFGLQRTGRLITNAAALLVVVIAAFATSEILFMKTLGVGMALAIALDATVIRALLVPAAMRLMGRWNWWAPAPLRRLWERAGLADH